MGRRVSETGGQVSINSKDVNAKQFDESYDKLLEWAISFGKAA